MHKPYIPAERSIPDFNPKTILLGVVLGAIFGSANAYLGLSSGLTISTSIPLAVISVAVLRAAAPLFGRSTILEANISQTAGSASSSLASGIIFTIPAISMWAVESQNPELQSSIFQITLLALCGGILGVLFMIPLRRFLVIKEHASLPYPEGTASAEVLIASSETDSSAKNIFKGLGIGALYKGMVSLLYLWPSSLHVKVPRLPKAEIGCSTTPALLGVGYILGRRIGTIMVGGGLLSWIVIMPLVYWKIPEARSLSSDDIWDQYIRIIGAGAVAMAGIITVIKSVPTMFESLRIGLREIRSGSGGRNPNGLRTEKDLPVQVILLGVGLVIVLLTGIPGILGYHTGLLMRFISALAIAVFAFCFVTVSSRIVGMIGVSSNPTSGMAIVTLLGVGITFKLLGWTDITGKITALTIGTVVCVAASIAGDISQDLKSGYLLGATPAKQQISELIGAAGSAFFIALAVTYLGKANPFGSPKLPAPQATLMKTVLDGVLSGNLNWKLVGIGSVISLAVFAARIPPLAFAVGVYLPLETMTPVFIGGMLRHILDRKKSVRSGFAEKGKDQGILFASGLIAGEGLTGVIIAVFAVLLAGTPKLFVMHYPQEWIGQAVSWIFFCILGGILWKIALERSE